MKTQDSYSLVSLTWSNMLYLIPLFLLSCGDQVAYLEVEEPLKEYVFRFKEEAITIGREITFPDLIVKFGETASKDSPKRIGYCYKKAGSPNLVVINEQYFNKANNSAREALIYHELGHCVLNRHHDDSCRITINGSCKAPNSLMYPSLITIVYEENKEFYIQELFSEMNSGIVK